MTAPDQAFLAGLQAEVQRWQHRLRLQDWHIDIRLCRVNDMPEGAVATIEPYLERKDAVISVLTPIDLPLLERRFPPGEAADYTLSIVHELLHLHLLPLSDYENDTKRIAEEQAINTISRALTLIHPKGAPSPGPHGD
jgi:hypothetical protein